MFCLCITVLDIKQPLASLIYYRCCEWSTSPFTLQSTVLAWIWINQSSISGRHWQGFDNKGTDLLILVCDASSELFLLEFPGSLMASTQLCLLTEHLTTIMWFCSLIKPCDQNVMAINLSHFCESVCGVFLHLHFHMHLYVAEKLVTRFFFFFFFLSTK